MLYCAARGNEFDTFVDSAASREQYGRAAVHGFTDCCFVVAKRVFGRGTRNAVGRTANGRKRNSYAGPRRGANFRREEIKGRRSISRSQIRGHDTKIKRQRGQCARHAPSLLCRKGLVGRDVFRGAASCEIACVCAQMCVSFNRDQVDPCARAGGVRNNRRWIYAPEKRCR